MTIKEILKQFNLKKRSENFTMEIVDIYKKIKEINEENEVAEIAIENVIQFIPDNLRNNVDFWKGMVKKDIAEGYIYEGEMSKVLFTNLIKQLEKNKYIGKENTQKILLSGLNHCVFEYFYNEQSPRMSLLPLRILSLMDNKMIVENTGVKKEFLQLLAINPKLWYSLDDELKNNTEIMLCFAKNVSSSQIDIDYVKIPERFSNDDEVMGILIKKYPRSILVANERIMNNKKLAKMVVKEDPDVFQKLTQSIQEDKEIAIVALQNSTNNFPFVRGKLRKDKEVIIEAVRSNYKVIDDLDSSWYADKDVIKEAIKLQGKMIRYATDDLRNNKKIARMAMRQNYMAYLDLGNDIKKDKGLFFSAIKQSLKDDKLGYGMETLYEGSPFVDDFDVTLEMLKKFKKSVMNKTDKLKSNREFFLKALDFINIFSYSEELSNDDEVIKKALKWKVNINHVDKNHKLYRENIVEAIIDYDMLNYEYEYVKDKRDILKELFEEVERQYNKNFEKKMLLLMKPRGVDVEVDYVLLAFDVLKDIKRGKQVIKSIYNDSFNYIQDDRRLIEAFINIDPNNILLINKYLYKDVELMCKYKDVIVKNKENEGWQEIYKTIEMFDREDKLGEKLSSIKKEEVRKKRNKI